MKVLITGASSGLGQCLAGVFHARGHELVLSGRKALPNLPGARHIYGDIREGGTLAKFSGLSIDIFINNAAWYPPKGHLADLTPRDIDTAVRTNLIAPIQILKAIGSTVGLLVSINSLAGKSPNSLEAVYCATKFGLRGFSESLRAGGMRTLDVYLGAMRTPMTKWRIDQKTLMDPEDVALSIYSAVFPVAESLRISELTLVKTKC